MNPNEARFSGFFRDGIANGRSIVARLSRHHFLDRRFNHPYDQNLNVAMSRPNFRGFPGVRQRHRNRGPRRCPGGAILDHCADSPHAVRGINRPKRSGEPSLAHRSLLPLRTVLLLALGWGLLLPSVGAGALSPSSPRVRRLADSGLKFLEDAADERLGAKCLVGLSFYKRGQRRHPLVAEALEDCQHMGSRPPEFITTKVCDIYSTSLAIVFLCTVDPAGNRREINALLESLYLRQKPAGGWGYAERETGDTSMTQYAALALWEARNHGIHIRRGSVVRFANWLLRTQDPSGGWGYQGLDPGSYNRVPQEDVGLSLSVAGLGSMAIAADLLKVPIPGARREKDLPAVVKRITDRPRENTPYTQGISQRRVSQSLRTGMQWLRDEYAISPSGYTHYYLYTLERYQSFRQHMGLQQTASRNWYDQGVAFLEETQRDDGSWYSRAGPDVDTAFAVLFLLRSMQQSIRNVQTWGDGVMAGGRGLPTNLERQLSTSKEAATSKVQPGSMKELLTTIHQAQGDAFWISQNLPLWDLPVHLDPEDAKQWQGLVAAEGPTARRVAVFLLGRDGDLDHVPRLIFALTDPDWNVAREANRSLLRISGKFSGFELPPRRDEATREAAIEQWKTWYRRIRPAALFDG